MEVRVFFRALQVFLDQPSLKAQYHYECANTYVVFSVHQSFAGHDLCMARAADVYGMVNVLFGICLGLQRHTGLEKTYCFHVFLMFDVVSSHVHDLIVNVLSQIDRSTKF
ncbi:hypothetical protein [Anaplasma phagocytophilum]|uniref:hypothetical protein n=1 Tax=Anaplasma phagocytophilum TaxID=948 RepID=UPI000533747A|nr:hypothetical protein [Anaplasma phagocytophilum]KDB55805.1 hypothetical protein P030_01575 [Anaplasma phagocytophilum str. CRT35]